MQFPETARQPGRVWECIAAGAFHSPGRSGNASQAEDDNDPFSAHAPPAAR